MRLLAQSYRGATIVFAANMDRFLVPLLIVAALLLAGSVFSYVTVH